MLENEYYTVDELAKRFKVNRRTIYLWVRQGKLKAVKIASLLRFTPEAVEEFIRNSNR